MPTLKGQQKRPKSLQKSVFVFLTACFISTSCFGKEKEQDYHWLDAMHKSIAESVTDSAQWFDDFFVDEEVTDKLEAKGSARIRLGWEPRTGDLNDHEARLRVRFKLPHLQDTVDVILSDYDDEVPEDKVRAGRAEDVNRQDRFSLALRYKARPDSGLSHRIGVGRRLQLFARSRYRESFDLNDDLNLHWEASVNYYNRDGFGADTEFTFDYTINRDSLFRFDNRFFYRDKSNDWLWQHSWQNFLHVNDKTALVFGYYIEGLSQPNYRLEEYLTSVRLRQNIFREWLYYEVEPYILWRRDESFSASYGIALRVEGYFGDY